ncbi:hypothetical protein J3B02_005129 [Coemansia erecta]|nr:hypothetical protein J3B02_005129 [Coemansia erecta]
MPHHMFVSLLSGFLTVATPELQDYHVQMISGQGNLSVSQRKTAIQEIERILLMRAKPTTMTGYSATQAPMSMASTVYNNQPIFVLQQQPSVPSINMGNASKEDDACVVCLSMRHSARACPLKNNKAYLEQRLENIRADLNMSDNKKFLAEMAIEAFLKSAS